MNWEEVKIVCEVSLEVRVVLLKLSSKEIVETAGGWNT